MNKSPTQSDKQMQLERIIGLASGVTGIISFSRDYPELGFLLLAIFIVVIFFIYQRDLAEAASISAISRKEKIQYIFQELVIKKQGYVFIILGIGVVFLAINFLYKEAKFEIKNGWVEPIRFQYEYGMSPVHLISINQNSRSLELLKKINPVLYYSNIYSDEAEISFETKDIDMCDEDQPCTDTSFGVDAIGLDPKNEFLEPTGNFSSHFDELGGYTRYKVKDNYTIFLTLNNCPVRDCTVRFHFIFKSTFSSSSTIATTIYISYLYGGTDRFNGLTHP